MSPHPPPPNPIPRPGRVPSPAPRGRRRGARRAVAAGLVLAAVSTVLAPGTAHAAGPVLTAEIVQTSTWSTGYSADVVITNTGDTESTDWTVEFDLPTGTELTNSWSAVHTASGNHHVFGNVSYNGDIAPGESEDFGFSVRGLALPADCTIDGADCGGGGEPDTQAPGVPGGLKVVSVTGNSVTLGWDTATDDTGVTGYRVSRDGTVAETTPATSATVTGLSPETAYTFTVAAFDAAGNVSSPSAPVTATTLPDSGDGEVIDVDTAAELTAALTAVGPGDTIRLAAGEYHGDFAANVAGTASQPITLTGPADAVLVNDGPSGSAPSCPEPTAGWDPGYGLWLYDSPHWNLTGFTVADSKKGIVIDASHHVTVDGVYVHHVEEEAVHFRNTSPDGVIRDSRITHTGLVKPQYGEGVYIGSANSNWDCYGNTGGADRSDRVQVVGNVIGPWVTAELIDVKEGTFDGVIRDNTFHGQGIAGQNSADSWVDVKGIDYLIEGNTGDFESPGVFAHGYETHNPSTSPSFQNGCGNVWRDNVSDLGGVGGWAINVTSTSKCSGNLNVVYASNTVSGATQGLTNITVTQ
ncbi:parallel beta helix pectate lyase-like protein [Stackebrandtia albiflava]|uniref:Parallel beta helix pectate lyase-like protein n=1 Tax=Stackebrandtia albiflava TaxID=406432 RepID=A0A562V9R0_9ACTN|nr:cellulose binding domain-containing protein [Stackebrandtia albiflava]TWJ14581.1 parallel beta helix pectate lyase-like protein [Stackebrandtia albiflava]